MACRNAYKTKNIIEEVDVAETSISEPVVAQSVNRLLFGVDSKIQANDLLQNNIEEFEWVVRNKIYPNFYGRISAALLHLVILIVSKNLNLLT